MNRYEDIVYLYCEGVIIDFAGEQFKDLEVAIPCNDTFAYASADAEEIPEGREHEVRTIYDNYSWPGVIAWCAKERGVEPLAAFLKQMGETAEYRYNLARKALEDK